MSARCELVIFDCDGVVVDSEPIGNRVFRELLAELGLRLSEADVYERFLGRGLADSLAIVEGMLGRRVPPATVERYRATRDQTLREEVRAIDGIERVIRSLVVPYCIASSGDHDKMHATLGATGLMALFEGRIFSATEVRRAKPAPDIYLYAAERMNAEPTRAIVVEDTVTGVTAARAAGMTVYGFAPLTPAEKLVAAGATAAVTDMLELGELLAPLRPPCQSAAKQ